MKINWNSDNKVFDRFHDLPLNTPFRNIEKSSKGAVYLKTIDTDGEYWMYEIATGRLWKPTTGRVEKVEIEVNVKANKPSIY